MDGVLYPFWRQDGGMLAGARFDKALHGDSDVPAFAIIGDLRESGEGYAENSKDDSLGEDILPVLSVNNEDSAANELRTELELGDNSFSIADLLSTGMASNMGDNFVAGARAEIMKARGDAAALLGLDTAPLGLRRLLDTTWAKAQTQVDNIFGSGKVDLKGRPGDDDLLGELDDILDALSSGPQFAAATEEDGKGVFEDAKLSESDALKAFDAAESEATAVFGMTGATRYGAVSAMERSVATKDPDYATGGNLGNGDADEMGLVGAFSYSTIDDVQRVWDIQTSGSAYYQGGTRAVSGDGKLYAGDIDLEVRFSSNRVSGLVSNLRSTAGDAWTFQYGEVESIILSPATLTGNQAHWSQADAAESKNYTARVTFSPRAGSPLPTPVRGTFQGQLLGRGDDSGNQAQGTWSVGEQTAAGSAAYLAGGFGAMRTDDGSPVRPGTDDGAVHETVVTSSDGVDDKDLRNTFKLDGGNLVVTMNRAGRYLDETADTKIPGPVGAAGKATTRTVLGAGKPPGDAVSLTANDDLWILDGDTVTKKLQNVTHELSQSLANIVANPQTDRNVNGPDKQVALAVKAIEAARSDLAVLQGLDTRITAQEVASWEKVQGALLRIFHHVPPKLAKAYAEDDALGLIDQALDAFSSENSLGSALDRDGRGIFNDVTKADGTSEPGAGLIWGRQEVQMKTHGGATDYTRWGVWRVRTDSYAARDAWTNFNYDDTHGNEPGSFAYSQLLPTKWSDHNDPGFPSGGSAMFVGGTTAIQGTNYFDGMLTVTAEWYGTWDGTDIDPLGTLSMRITDLANSNGDPFKDGLYAIVISAVSIHTNMANEVIFNSAGVDGDSVTGQMKINSSGTFQQLTGTQGLMSKDITTSSVMGKFVGQDIEGPLGVIGTYELGKDNFGAALRGSFGADRP